MSFTPTSTSSGLQTADAVISATPAAVHSVTVIGDGTNAATVVIYDNASAASGTVLAKVVVDAGLTFEHITFDLPAEGSKGIYADVTGTGAEYIVHFYKLG